MKKTNFLLRSWAICIFALCTTGWTFGQTHITDRAGLEAIKNNLSGDYVLDNDINLSGSNWTPLGDFTGTFDGNNHVISNMTPIPRDGSAFFIRIKENAVVKNLGFENANIDGGTNVRCAVLTGYLEGAAVIENCYIANSTVKGRWCIGSFVGRAQNIANGAAVRNCYSSAFIFATGLVADGNGHAGGIIGNIYYNGTNNITVENCYFSGIVQKEVQRGNDEGQIAGIVGWNGHDGSNASSTVKNNVNLAPYLLGASGKHRISSQRSDNVNYGNPAPGPNYSLSTTIVSGGTGWENTSDVIPTDGAHYGAALKDGLNIPGGDANAKAQNFYETTLGWDFTDTWKIDESNTYPVLKWTDATRPNFIVVNSAPVSLTAGVSVDLSKRIFSGRGLGLTFTPNSDKIVINGSMVSFAQDIAEIETVTVSVQEGDLEPETTLQINLVPNIIHITDRAGLEAIGASATALGASYILDNDIDLAGSNWTPLGTTTVGFSGTLDGNGHVISNLTPTAQDGTALFTRIQGNAVVKNLGFEGANIDGVWNVRVAVLTGYMAGNAVIENCYVANSTVKGRWHVGSFVGRMDGGNTVIRNCYSSAYLFTPTGTQNTDIENIGHIAGIVGVLNAGGCKVENCYFSGVIQKNPSVFQPNTGQMAGIVAWNSNSGNIIANNVNLAPYLLSNTGKYRISSVQDDPGPGGNDPSGPNYSLSTTVVSVINDWGNTSATVAIDNVQYGQNKRHGENIPDGDDNAKAQAFYSGLGWDFDDTWTIDEGNAYPVLKWTDATRPHFVVVNPGPVSLTADAPVDLSKLIFSGRGLGLTFTPNSDKITIDGGTLSFAKDIAEIETVSVSVQEGSLTPAYLQIELIPNIIHITDRAGLEAIGAGATALGASYILDDDIDLSGANWTPLGNFTGTLDGDGHVISNMTISNLTEAAFFKIISGNATVKNLGFEKASVTTEDPNHARTAVLAAYLQGNAVIENCYIANSLVIGRWCVGSFVGRAQSTNSGNGAAIRNCYSSASLYIFATGAGGTGHIGGIIGNIFDHKVTVENCYFSGIIQKEPNTHGNAYEGQVAGIVGWNGTGGPHQTNVTGIIKNNVNLSPYLLSNNGKRRIASSSGDAAGGEPTPGPNYSLSTTIVSVANDWGNTSAIVDPESAHYGAALKDGLNIPDGDENAKAQSFYETLDWDFDNVWTMSNGGYPVFSWEKNTTHFVAVPEEFIPLTSKSPVDLSKYIFSGRGLILSFSEDDNRIDLAGSSASLTPVATAGAEVTVAVQEGSLTDSYVLTLVPTPSERTWTGSADTDWTNPANWDGSVPVAFDNIIISAGADNYPVLTAETSVNSLTLEPGAELGGQHYLTIAESATVNYDLVADRWHLLSSPIETTAEAFYHEDSPVAGLKKFTPVDNTAGWSFVTDLAAPLGTGEGFAYQMVNEAKTVTVAGELSNETQLTQALSFGTESNSAFALAGNPFVSTIDFDALQEDNKDVITDSYLIWVADDSGNEGYAGYNPDGDWGFTVPNGLDKYIAPLQSFIVEKKSDATTDEITFNANIQATANHAGLRSAENPADRLSITASNAVASVRTFIAKRENGHSPRKLFAPVSEVPDIYLLDGTTACGARIIRTDDITVPLGIYTASAESLQLTFTGMDSYNAQITLIDNEEEITLTGLSSYTHVVTPAGAPVEDRFAIRFSPGNAMGIATIGAVSEATISTRYYNLQGLPVSNPTETGIYIVKKVYESGKSKVSKLIIRNK
jgi:hypothetical protein